MKIAQNTYISYIFLYNTKHKKLSETSGERGDRPLPF